MGTNKDEEENLYFRMDPKNYDNYGGVEQVGYCFQGLVVEGFRCSCLMVAKRRQAHLPSEGSMPSPRKCPNYAGKERERNRKRLEVLGKGG
ncbi:hypothetical protein NMG60_11000265 [Bertholletia excelsa]